VAGGITGGDCWGGNASGSLSPEPEAQLEGLVEMLEQEDVLLRHANVILRLVEKGEKTFHGYYDNSETIAWKFIRFDAVYEKLAEFGYAMPKVEHAP
jgi:hypothetical protein